MAKGKSCPEPGCGMSMSVEREDDQPAGRYVTYVCPDRKCGFKEKVFENYQDR